MKREGRQHGMVRIHGVLPSPWNPRRYNKIVNEIETPPTAGIYMKVSSKPTNHSKFTGKCGRSRCNGCHTHPVSKSKDKAKGTHKGKAFDVLVNDRSIAWKFGGHSGGGSNYVGLSATTILGQLATRDDQDWSDYDDDEEEEEEEEEVEKEMGYGDDGCYGNDYYNNDNLEDIVPVLTTGGIEEIVDEPEEPEEPEKEGEDENEGDDDDDTMSIMSFCEVGFLLELEEEGWFVVEEL